MSGCADSNDTMYSGAESSAPRVVVPSQFSLSGVERVGDSYYYRLASDVSHDSYEVCVSSVETTAKGCFDRIGAFDVPFTVQRISTSVDDGKDLFGFVRGPVGGEATDMKQVAQLEFVRNEA